MYNVGAMKKSILTFASVSAVAVLTLTGCTATAETSLDTYIPATGQVSFDLNGFDTYLKTDGWTLPEGDVIQDGTFMATKPELNCTVMITTVSSDAHLEKNESDNFLSKKFLYENVGQNISMANSETPQMNTLPEPKLAKIQSNVGLLEAYTISYEAPLLGTVGGEGEPTLPSSEIVGTLDAKAVSRFFNTNYETEAGYKAGSAYYANISCAEGLLKQGNWDKLLSTVQVVVK